MQTMLSSWAPGVFTHEKINLLKFCFLDGLHRWREKYFFSFPTDIFFRLTHETTFFPPANFSQIDFKKQKNSQNILVFFPLIFTQESIQGSFHALNLKTFSPSFFTQEKKIKCFYIAFSWKNICYLPKKIYKITVSHMKTFCFSQRFSTWFFSTWMFFFTQFNMKKNYLKKVFRVIVMRSPGKM